jgi:hypothetical protein
MVKSGRAKRMEKHHKRNKSLGTLNLVSLMDIFTILVFFLLVNSSDVETLPNAKDLQLPESIAETKAKETVVIMIGEVKHCCRRTIACCGEWRKTKSSNVKSRSWAIKTYRTGC